MNTTTYASISPRQKAFTKTKLLERAKSIVVLEKWGQVDTLPRGNTNIVIWRRYLALLRPTAPLSETVVPAGQTLSCVDVSCTLEAFGDLVWITRKITDFHEDPVLEDAGKNLGEIMAENTEIFRFNMLKAGTVCYFPGTATTRATVNGVLDATMLRKMERSLKRNRARTITELVAPTVKYGTEAVNPAYWIVGHTDCKADIEQIPGFVPAKMYSSGVAIEGEIGSWGSFRFVLTDLFEPWVAAGYAGTTYLSGRDKVSGATACDVYPLLVFGKDAYGIVPFAGKEAVELNVWKPGTVSPSQPMGQQGFVSAFRYEGCSILQDAYMGRFEVAATAL